MKTLAIIQARMTSTRLPGKILMKIGGQSLLEINLRRIAKADNIDKIVVATTNLPSDDKTAELVESLGFAVFRGDENDVLDRFYQAASQQSEQQSEQPKYIVRLTADCPLIDAELIDKIIRHTLDHELDYCSNTLDPHYPDGQDAEVFKFSALQQAWQEAKLPSEREHVTPYIWSNSTFKGGTLFKSDNYAESGKNYGHLRMTVDERADYELISALISKLGTDRSWQEYADCMEQHIEIKGINHDIARNEGFTKSLQAD
ncbi:cytidylyltransferase domain-containing protein [Persicitalea sp.]|uniref:cytidylyltransferase domain-containing protein n=1 Tax=Persicitalea sp. TaxID=3100273 RepID=UPI0035938528